MAEGKRRGAAFPKAARYVKPGQAQVRLECSLHGVHHRVRRYTPDQAREACAEGETCQAEGNTCGAVMIPSAVEDCAELAPDLLHLHPVHIEDARAEGERELRQIEREWNHAPDHRCGGCGEPMPAHLDPDEWYCRKCRRINGRTADGGREVFDAPNPFSAEVERCNGLARTKPAREKRKVSAEPERVKVGQIATPDPDMPF
jgi:hypothetical protein